MLLRESGKTEGQAFNLHAVTNGAKDESGVAHGEALLAFTEAIVGADVVVLAAARARVREEMSPEAMVDAAAVASNFERMVRIADSTGIPLDKTGDEMSADVQTDLHLEQFKEAANTRSADLRSDL